MLAPDFYLLKVKDELPNLPNTKMADVSGNSISYEVFPEDFECSDGKADGIGTFTLGPGVEAVALYKVSELCCSSLSVWWIMGLLADFVCHPVLPF